MPLLTCFVHLAFQADAHRMGCRFENLTLYLVFLLFMTVELVDTSCIEGSCIGQLLHCNSIILYASLNQSSFDLCALKIHVKTSLNL